MTKLELEAKVQEIRKYKAMAEEASNIQKATCLFSTTLQTLANSHPSRRAQHIFSESIGRVAFE